MATNPINGFYELSPEYPRGFNSSLSFITPFTHRTNISYAELLFDLYKWLREKHLPELDEVLAGFKLDWETFSTEWLAKYQADFDAVKADINATKDQWNDFFNQFMANVLNELEALNDEAVTNLIENPNSQFGAKTRDLFVLEGRAFADIAKYPGVDPTGVTECSTAIQTAIDDIASRGERAYAIGTFRTNKTLLVKSSLDFQDATFNYSGSATAIIVGDTGSGVNDYIMRTNIILPRITNTNKTVNGWAQVTGSIGVLISNYYTGEVTVPEIINFDKGLVLSGHGVNGVSYLNFHLGHLQNNKINILFTNNGGWANQNNFYGGRLSHDSNEGSNVPGVKNVVIEGSPHPINNNTFWGTSLESPNVDQYLIDCSGFDNFFIACRFENTGERPRVRWGGNSAGNVILWGIYAGNIDFTNNSTGSGNHLISRYQDNRVSAPTFGKAMHTWEASSGNAIPIVRLMSAGSSNLGADETTKWRTQWSASGLGFKLDDDLFPRIEFMNNGTIRMGNGTAKPASTIVGSDSGLMFNGSHGFYPTNTIDVGTTTAKPRYVRAGTGIQTATFTTDNRPSPTEIGAGVMVFDVTLLKPIWSAGSVWVDATGTIV